MNLEPPLAFLGEAIGDSISVEELFKQIPDRSGNLLKLVWMLERGGLLGRKDRPIDTNLADRLTAVGVQADDPDVIATLLAWAKRQLDQGQPEAPEPEAPEPTPTAAVQVGATPAAIRVQPGPASPSEGDDESVAHSVPPASSTSSVPPRSHGPLGDDDAPQIDIGNFASRGSRSTGNATGSPRSVSRRAEPTMTPARISREHTKRLERDFYGFLGIKVGAPSGVVDRRCKVLAKRWSAARELDLEDHTRRQLNQLLHGLQIVWQTLAHDDRKEEYDRRMKDGQPPKVDEIRRALEGAEGLQAHNQAEEQAELEAADGADVAMARRLISRGAFGAASRLLERLRRSEPSSPDVLAELGWAVWKLRGSSGGENDPEDFIALALTFAPRHIPALEYHARIAYERGDHDALQDRLDRLLSADRENSWAVRVLSGDTHSTPPSRRSGGGLRFWRRKSD
jgi:hypothetical protein